MKITKEAVNVVGLSTLYEPDSPSEIDLDVVFVHGLGGHSVETWLQTFVNAEMQSQTIDEPSIFTRPVGRVPTRRKALKRVEADPRIKRGKTLKKRPPNNKQAPPTGEKQNRPPQSQLVEQEGLKLSDSQGQYSGPTYPELTRSLAKIRSTATSPSPVELETYQMSTCAAHDTYWPLDLLPESCPSTRIFTYGFETRKVQESLSTAYLDLLARGKQLFQAVCELRRNGKPGRELVFIAHSTGGIVVKEMLRLASDHRDTDNEGLLATVASVIFLGCPLLDTDYGSMTMALKSMAAVTMGVSIDDEVYAEVLDGYEDTHLIHLGRDAFDALWREYNFRVKTFRETTIESPQQPWAELGLALRRCASTLPENLEDDEDLPGDHVNMCRFASRSDEGYQRVSSYLARLAHYQALKRQELSVKDKQIQQTLVDSGASDVGTTRVLLNQRRLSAALSSAEDAIPRWLLQHQKVQTWLRRSVREDWHKLLWLNGPLGSGVVELLSSLRTHLEQRWAPESHSSVIITINAEDGQPLLDSTVFADRDTRNSHDSFGDDERGNHDSAQERDIADDKDDLLTTGSKSSVTSAHETPQDASPTPNTPVHALRSLLSQLYTYDPRLRNLVRKRTATSGTLHNDDLLVETLLTIPNSPDPSKHHNVVDNYNLATTTRNKTTTFPNTSLSEHPTETAVDWFSGGQTETRAQGQEEPAKILDDAEVWALFWEDYLCLGLPERQTEEQLLLNGKQTNSDDFKIGIPGIRRVFILVDAAAVVDNNHLRGLLCWLRQLARRSEFSVCVASTATMLTGSSSSRPVKSPSESTLLIQVPEENADEISSYLDRHLALDMEERSAIAAKMLDQAAGVMLWAEMVTTIVNEASEEGVSGEIVLSMLDDIAPGRHGSEGLLDDLYAWKLRRLGAVEQAQALVVMQWVMLVPEPLRLNELLVALRLTLLTCRRASGSDSQSNFSDCRLWDISKTLVVEPAMSLKELRAADGDPLGMGMTMMDSPAHFWKWLKHLSQGMLRLELEGSTNGAISREPLGLQRVRPAHESVHRFFIKGKGFQTLLPTPSNDDPQAYNRSLPSTDRFIDTSYYTLLHVCLVYLNITELDALGREKPPLNPAPGSALPPVETSKWRAHTDAQRRMVMSSYPLLRYVVDHLVFHLLCPREYRYFLPQGALLAMFSANRCRIWRRWTHLLGFSIADAAPEALLARAEKSSAGRLLAPVYGARYRLERVLRRVWRTAVEQQRAGGGTTSSNGTTPRTTPKRAHFRSRSDVSEGSMVFMLMGGEDPLKASWLVPTSPGRPKAVEAAPRALMGIEETGSKEEYNMGEEKVDSMSV